MSTPRRRLIRPAISPNALEAQRQRRTQHLRSRLDRERLSLRRWMSRLKRAFHAVERLEARIARIDRQLDTLETTRCTGSSN